MDENRHRWPFGLQKAAVREAYEAERQRGEKPIIYVHARGKFGDPRQKEAYRSNLGPRSSCRCRRGRI